MNLHTEVERAVAHAPICTPGKSDTNNDFSSCADQPDDYPIHFNADGVLAASNEVLVNTACVPDLSEIYRVLAKIRDVAYPDMLARNAALHEGQHLRAAEMLGATSTYHGIRLAWKPAAEEGRHDLLVQPISTQEDFLTTRLGDALIRAYPFCLSQGDEEDIKGYGYTGVHDLAQRAMARNKARKSADAPFYPVPLSCTVQSEEWTPWARPSKG